MEQSSSTLIVAVNKVLENIGERRVLNINTPVARKAVEALKDALADISSMNDWEFVREYIPAQSWNLETANLGNTSRIHNVQYGSTTQGYRNVPYVDLEVFDYKPVIASTNFDFPSYYTIETYNRVRVNPYPANATEQAYFRFYVSRELVAPTDPDASFPLPERLMNMLYLKAQSILALTHLDDTNGYKVFGQQYEMYVQRLRDRERLSPSNGNNAFKQRGLRRVR